jgi:hypothetical protein
MPDEWRYLTQHVDKERQLIMLILVLFSHVLSIVNVDIVAGR